MTNELEDWQLALLVEAKRCDDPTVVEAAAAETYRDHKDLIEQAEALEMPVAVERDAAQKLEKADDLLEAAEGIDDWEVVPTAQREAEREACEAIEDLLSDALCEHNGLRESVVADMSAPQMVEQFRDDDSDGIALEALAQHPETGGEPETPDDGGGGDDPDGSIDDLSAEERNLVAEKLEKADRMEDRTPDYADSLRQEAADIVGVDDAAAINTEVL